MTIPATATPVGAAIQRIRDLEQLRDRIDAELTAARARLRRLGHVNVGSTRTVVPAGHDPAAVRTWARSNGWPDLGIRGRLPAEAIAAYLARPHTKDGGGHPS